MLHIRGHSSSAYVCGVTAKCIHFRLKANEQGSCMESTKQKIGSALKMNKSRREWINTKDLFQTNMLGI